MNFDPTHFASPMYETANETVLFCKESLEAKGYPHLAQQLAGFIPVSDFEVARIVLSMLTAMKPSVTGEAAEYVAIACDTVARALRSDPRSALSACA